MAIDVKELMEGGDVMFRLVLNRDGEEMGVSEFMYSSDRYSLIGTVTILEGLLGALANEMKGADDGSMAN